MTFWCIIKKRVEMGNNEFSHTVFCCRSRGLMTAVWFWRMVSEQSKNWWTMENAMSPFQYWNSPLQLNIMIGILLAKRKIPQIVTQLQLAPGKQWLFVKTHFSFEFWIFHELDCGYKRVENWPKKILSEPKLMLFYVEQNQPKITLKTTKNIPRFIKKEYF